MDRSENMRRIRSKDTAPEVMVRQLVFSMGYRYRLHRADLPGQPDLVFPGRRKIILVHGCFWHQHNGCKITRLPRSNESYWLPKLARNTARDRKHILSLRAMGWKCLTIWECETKESKERLAGKIAKFLG